MTVELVLGGARSGKSRYALDQAQLLAPQEVVCWLATAQAFDAEMSQRIDRHKNERPVHWHTLETPFDLATALQQSTAPVLVVDCLTLWLSNWLCLNPQGFNAEAWHVQRDGFFNQLSPLTTSDRCLLLVSNEVGFGIVPDNALARQFRDEAGRLHQQIAAMAQRVTLVVAGLPLAIKSF